MVIHIHADLVGGPQMTDVAAAGAGKHIGKIFLRRQERRVTEKDILTDGERQVEKPASEPDRIHHFERGVDKFGGRSDTLPV